jgi:pilus assembly protein Flp/PilA
MATSFSSLVKSFARDDRGATLVEYSVLVGLITIAVIAAVATLSGAITTALTTVAGVITTQTGL